MLRHRISYITTLSSSEKTENKRAAHAQPHAVADSQQSTASLSRGSQTVVPNAFDTTLRIVKEVADLLQDAPFVKPLAGALLQIITIREEMEQNRTRCHDLIDKVVRRSAVIFEGLRNVSSPSQRDMLRGIEGKLTDYKDFLEDVLSVLQRHKSTKMFRKLVHRASYTEDLARCNRRLDDYNTDFMTSLLLGLGTSNFATKVTGSAAICRPILPSPPKIVVGRDDEKSLVVNALLHCRPSRIAIVGGAGLGKTTLALSSIHDPRVVNDYSSIYFISCESATTLQALVNELANALEIPSEQRQVNLARSVLSKLQQTPTLLCLDNLETTWEETASRSETEAFLRLLDDIPNLSLVVTMRGSQRPARVSWSKPLLQQLMPLNMQNSLELFENIHGPADIFAQRLLDEVDGIPLAIELIASLLEEGNERSDSLWARWQRDRTMVVENGGLDRQCNLNASIRLSVECPRMRADQGASSVLAMISLLPDGLCNTEFALDNLQHHLPKIITLRQSLLTLKRVSLIHVKDTASHSRLKLLSPVRHYCQSQLSLPSDVQDGLTNFYVDLIHRHQDSMNASNYAVLPSELPNARAVLLRTHATGRVSTPVVMASIIYTDWCISLGNFDDSVISSIPFPLAEPAESRKLQGDCLQVTGRLYTWQNRWDEAEKVLIGAVDLHKVASDPQCEGTDFSRLGLVYTLLSRLDDAEKALIRAIELHALAGDALNEGIDWLRLGDLYMQLGRLEEGEKVLLHSIKLLKLAHATLAEGSASSRLGELYLRQERLEEAEHLLLRAVMLHRLAHSALSEGTDWLCLGEIYLRWNKLDEAETVLLRASALHKEANDARGEGCDLAHLGDVYLRQNRLEEAEKVLLQAMTLHEQAQATADLEHDSSLLTRLYALQGNASKASFYSARVAALPCRVQSREKQPVAFIGLNRLHYSSPSH